MISFGFINRSPKVIIMTPEQIFTLIAAFVAVVGAIATAVMTFMRSRGDLSKEVIINYEALDKQNKEQLNDWKNRTMKCEELHREASAKMGNLQGQLDTTLAILKDRNPETTEFMRYMVQIGKEAEISMKEGREQRGILVEIRDFIHGVNEQMKARPPVGGSMTV